LAGDWCVAVLLLTVIAGVLQYRWINFAADVHRRQGREVMAGTLRNSAAISEIPCCNWCLSSVHRRTKETMSRLSIHDQDYQTMAQHF